MNNWNEGYFTDSTYTYGYYNDISPTWQNFCLLVNGYVAPEQNQNSVYCELGFGQGVSANIHAAATEGKYFGTDFNPSQAAHANELCKASGADAKFFDDSFEETLNRDDLPQFDSISLHGIWSWISPENQKHIVNFARKFLKQGGVFYNSYNCYPGWSPAAPMRELFALYDKYARKSGKTFERIEEALNFTEELFSKNPAYFSRVPDVKTIFDGTKKLNHNYLAHEYFNRDWICMYFSEVAEILQNSAKLDFACTSMIAEALPQLNFSAEALEFLNKIENPIMREQVKDYFLNRQFRKDIYVKGSRKISQFELFKRLTETNYILMQKNDLPRTVSMPLGEVTLSDSVVEKIQKHLSEKNYAPQNFADFLKNNSDITPTDLIQVLLMLVQDRSILPCQTETAIQNVKKKCVNLNKYICRRAKISDDINFVASPVLGGGHPLNRFDRVFLSAMYEGKNNADELGNYAWQIFSEQGLRLTKPEGTLTSDEENLTEFKNMAKDFTENRLPILKALQVI